MLNSVAGPPRCLYIYELLRTSLLPFPALFPENHTKTRLLLFLVHPYPLLSLRGILNGWASAEQVEVTVR
ncbi:hypothetical protein VTI74DRAFT_2923 [Chaetomium olivicolor]